MSSLLKFFISSCLLISAFKSATSTSSTRDYINTKLEETKDLIYKAFSEYDKSTADKSSVNLRGNWRSLWREKSIGRHPHAVSLHDQVFIIDDQQQVFSITSKSRNADNNIQTVTKLKLAQPNDPVKFSECASWNERIFLLVCQTTSCTHYEGSNISNLENRQVIEYNGSLTINARFFIHQQQVYLIISYYVSSGSSSYPTVSKMYQWTSVSMNLVNEIPTPVTNAIVTFPDDESTILLFAFEHNELVESGESVNCVLYELNDNNNIEFIKYLANPSPVTSIYHYNYGGEEFLFFISDDPNSSAIYWWDGTDLIKWIDIPDVKPSSLIKIIIFNNEVLLLICDSDALHIYVIGSSSITHLNDLNLKKGERVAEIAMWENKNSLMLALIKDEYDGTYQIELRQLHFHHEQPEYVESDEVWNCFKELQNLLSSKMSAIENLRSNWPKLLPANKNVTMKTPLHLSNLILEEGSISTLEFKNLNETAVFSPLEINNELLELEKKVDEVLNTSTNVVSDDKISILSGNVVVSGDVFFQELHIDDLRIDYLNDQKMDMEKLVISGIDQNFTEPLRAKAMFIDNLQVPTLCGIDSEYWVHVNDLERIALDDINLNSSSINNDTIFVENDLILNQLNTKYINSLNIESFLEDAFIIGKNQTITGNVTYKGVMQVSKLSSNLVNNVSSSALFTRHTNQTLDDIFIDTLEVNHLYVNKINGVPINETARMSQENVIKGKVTIGNFVITDEMIVNEDVALPLTRSTQVYDDIIIMGDIIIKNLQLEEETSLVTDHLNSTDTLNVYDILENSWSKSRNQVIKNSIVFEKGASIDELSCQYLNGLSNDDFLYTNATELSDLDNVTFANFHFDKVVSDDTGNVENFYTESSSLLTFHKPIRMSHLSVDSIVTDNYNGIPVELIMQSNDSLNFLGVTEFDVVRIDDEMIVDQLQIDRLNLKNASLFEQALRTDQPLRIESLKVDSVNMHNIEIKQLCNKNLEEALLAQENLSNQRYNISLTIDADVEIEDSLEVDTINNEEVVNYMYFIKDTNLEDLLVTKNLKDLRIKENLNISLLNGRDINEIFHVALSRTNMQSISGDFFVTNAKVTYLDTEIINNVTVSKLMYTDEPCTFNGDVLFSELFVEGTVKTKTLQGTDVSKIQEDLRVIPMAKNPMSIHIFGNMSWDTPLSNLNSIDKLLRNAVTKDENQLINSPVILEKPVTIDSLYLKETESPVLQKINQVISDAVIDDKSSNSILIKGTKIFKHGLSTGDLEVVNNIDIAKINDFDIRDLNSQMFRKYGNDTISSEITFLGDVEIANLRTNSRIHGVSLHDLATSNKKMPKNMHFESLIVRGNVTLHTLDGIDFEDFKRKRVTTYKDHEVYGDIQFNSPVTVLNGTVTSIINGIKPSNLVVGGLSQVPNVIYGKKTFLSSLVVEGNIEADEINKLNIAAAYHDSILSYENIEIFGNLIFEDDVENSGSISVSGKVNDLDTQDITRIQNSQEEVAAKVINKGKNAIEYLISSSINSSIFGENLLYLEEDNSFNLYVPGVRTVRSMSIGPTTRLDIYTSVTATFCGLPSNCSCRKAYIAEISPQGSFIIQQKNSTDVSFNFYDPNDLFGLKIVTSAVSKNQHCSRDESQFESSRVYWMKFDDEEEAGVQKPVLQINGYIADAQKFVIDDRLYLILAIFYDKTVKSHATDSLVYEFNLQNKEVNQLPSIATDGAKTVHVFQIPYVGIFVLFGCVKGRTESPLLRFNRETRQFQLVRAFATGGSKHIASVNSNDKNFVILNNPDIEALQIFVYNSTIANFCEYQNLYFESRVTSLKVFYAGDIENSDAFVVTTTKDGWFFIYEYMFYEKFQRKVSYWMEDIQVLSPFRHMNKNYLFAGTKINSTIFKVIQQGIY